MAGDVTHAVVSGALNTGASDTTDFTKSGFGTPKGAIITLTYDASDDANSATEYKFCVGITDFTDSRFMSVQTEDASASEDCNMRKGQNDAYYLLDTAGGDDGHGDASAITDGVRLTNQAAFSRAVFVEITMFGGADLSVDCGSHVITNRASGNTNSTTTSIDQDIIFFIGLFEKSEDSTVSTDIMGSFGVATTGREASQSIVNRSQSFTVDHNASSGDPVSIIRNDGCYTELNSSGIVLGRIELTSADATSFTTTVRSTVGSGQEVYYLALALDPEGSRRKSEVGSIDSPTASGDWSETGLGFTPGYVGLGLNRLTAENTAALDATAGSVGVSHNTGSGEETCHSFYDEDAAATINANNCFRSRAIYFFEDDGSTIAYDLSHSSFNSDGWTCTQVGTPSSTARKWFYWAIEEPTAGVTDDLDPYWITAGQQQPRFDPPEIIGY